MGIMAGKRQCKALNFLVITSCVMLIWSAKSWGVEAQAKDNVTADSLEQTASQLRMFVDKLPTMPLLKTYTVGPDGQYTSVNLTIGMYQTVWKFHSDLPPTPVFAFGLSQSEATVPGPSIESMSGVKAYVLWENHLPTKHLFTIDGTLDEAKPKSGIPTVVHLHGSVSEGSSDGNALAWFTNNYTEKGPHWKTAQYLYYNARTTGNMWYHDHALGFTRLNLLAGLIGAYKVVNPPVEDPFWLPRKNFDKQLVVMDRDFNKSGYIYINSTGNNPDIHPEWQPEYFGNVVIVNGKAWPYLTVQRRKYRFRIINASNARFYRFALDDGTNFTQIGADSFYLQTPVVLQNVLVAPSEIIDIVIDFSQAKNESVILTNDAAFPFPDGDPTNDLNGKVMKFIIKPAKNVDNSRIPAQLVPVQKLALEDAVVKRNIVLFEFESSTEEPTHLLINFRNFSAPVTELPRQGTTEVWYVINLTDDNHPLHIHIAGFQVLGQQKLNNTDALKACASQYSAVEPCNLEQYYDGAPTPPPANEAGWKNVFKMQPSFVTTILVRFSLTDLRPFPFDASGEPGYAYHCHILDHEDNSMMRPFQMVA